MERLCTVGVAGLLAIAACVEPLPPAETTAGASTGAPGGTTGTTTFGGGGSTGSAGAGSADPGGTTAPPTSGPGSSGGGDPQTTGGPDGALVPIVTEVWSFDAMDLGDVDGDGRLDLVTSGTGAPPRVTVYPGRGDGTFDREAAVETAIFGFDGFVLGDVDGDGRADVLAHGTGAPPRVSVYAGGDDFGFTELSTTEVVAFTHLHASDMNGDGRADLLIGAGDSLAPWVQVWPGGAAGIAGAPVFVGETWRYDLLRSGDVDGDGRPDLVTASAGAPPQLRVHPGDGAGGFGAPASAQIHDLSWLDLGDVDGDGRADAATDIPNNAWRFQIYRAQPGGWADAVAYDGFNFAGFELGDVDGDGLADLVARASGAPPRVEVYLASAL